MEAYKLYIKSEISDIDNKALHAFLTLSGYLVSAMRLDICELLYNNLEEARKVESKLRKMFSCILVLVNLDGTETNRIVNLTFFKESGKYYDNFDVEIPVSIKEFDLVDTLLKVGKLRSYFTYYGYYANNVPFIIPAHAKPSKPYVKDRIA